MIELLKQLILALTKKRDILAAQNAPQPASQVNSEPSSTIATPTANPRQLLDLMCAAITDYEGGPADLNHRNLNPGNIRSWPTQIGTNKGFAVFRSWEEGMSALRQLITLAAMGKTQSYKPTMSLLEFFEKYAPGSDNNHPLAYAKFVARRMGVDITFQIKNLV